MCVFVSLLRPVTGKPPDSFLLCSCCVCVRPQLLNLGYKPYGHHLKKLRADRLISMYPEYHQNIVRDFSSTRYLRHSRG